MRYKSRTDRHLCEVWKAWGYHLPFALRMQALLSSLRVLASSRGRKQNPSLSVSVSSSALVAPAIISPSRFPLLLPPSPPPFLVVSVAVSTPAPVSVPPLAAIFAVSTPTPIPLTLLLLPRTATTISSFLAPPLAVVLVVAGSFVAAARAVVFILVAVSAGPVVAGGVGGSVCVCGPAAGGVGVAGAVPPTPVIPPTPLFAPAPVITPARLLTASPLLPNQLLRLHLPLQLLLRDNLARLLIP